MNEVVTGTDSLLLSVEGGRPKLTHGEFVGRQWPGGFLGRIRPLRSLYLLQPEVFEELSQPLAIRLVRRCQGNEGEGYVEGWDHGCRKKFRKSHPLLLELLPRHP